MRKPLLACCLLLTTIGINAQHLVFRDIPINGPLDEFVAEMTKLGYRENKDAGTTTHAVLKGEFAGMKSVYLFIQASRTSHTVYEVGVASEEKKSTWYGLKSAYQELVSAYKKKYGQPYLTYADFDTPFYEGDGYEMLAVKRNKCHFATVWQVQDIGKITVAISSDASCLIIYEDALNTALDKQEKGTSIYNDI